MKRRVFLPLLAGILCLVNVLTAFALDVEPPKVIDDGANILSAELEDAMTTEFTKNGSGMGIDILLVTVESRGTDGADDLSEKKFKEYMKKAYGEEKDGILLLLCMQESDWAVYATGKCQKAITKDGIEMIKANVLPSVASGDYENACKNYMNSVIVLLAQADVTGEAYREPFNVVSHLAIALVIGLILAFVVTGSMKGQLTSVRRQTAAASYIKQNSLKVTQQNEVYLYKKVERKEKANAETASANTASIGKSANGKF